MKNKCLFFVLLMLINTLSIHARMLIDESNHSYSLRKTGRYRYKHPQQARYYPMRWWQAEEPVLDECIAMRPIRYYRNGWPYYWFY